jgi:hypothetical protein
MASRFFVKELPVIHSARWLLVAFALTPAFAAAQGAKAPDLSNLRDAVAAASKRGANLDEVARALDALEKALAKGFTPPKAGATAAPPPELVALREAVETAGRKGERVDAVRKELDAVEIAMTGKAYERPRPVALPDPSPRFEPQPNFGGRRGGVVIRGGEGANVVIRGGGNVTIRGMQLGGGRGGNSTTITLSGTEFTIKSSQDALTYLIQGAIGDSGPIIDKVTITDGDKKPVEVKSLKDVPEQHKPAVERLLKSIGRD